MYDFIIAGGGPAGASAACLLAKNGSVLVIEREEFPRYKSCGGALSYKAVSLLKEDFDFNTDMVTEREIKRVNFIYKLGEQKTGVDFDYPIINMCMRDNFDSQLLNNAEKNGAKINFSEEVADIEEAEGHVRIITDKDEYKSRYFIGAEGANSVTAKKLLLDIKKTVAVEGELNQCQEEVIANDEINLFYGVIPHGYGWIFPKTNNLSIGVCSFNAKIKGINGYYNNFKDNLELNRCSQFKFKGHAIPLLTNFNRIPKKGRILAVGDAAGLVDPFCGEGIYYALLSGKFAAEAILKENIKEYHNRIKNIIFPEFKHASILAVIIYNNMPLINKLVTHNPSLIRNLLEVTYGNMKYSSLLNSLKSEHPIFNVTGPNT